MLRHPSLELTACVVSKEGAMDLRQELMEGRVPVSQMGSVVATGRLHPPFVVVDTEGVEVAAVTECLGDLAASDCSPLTCRSYAFALLRWFRVLWLLGVDWDRATEGEVTVLVGWFRSAANPQRRRRGRGSGEPGSVNLRTGKPTPAAGYAPRTVTTRCRW